MFNVCQEGKVKKDVYFTDETNVKTMACVTSEGLVLCTSQGRPDYEK